MQRCMSHLAVLVWTWLWIGPAAGAPLVIFDESPRGLYDFDTMTGAFALRAPMSGSERFFGMDTRPSDGAVFAVDLWGGGLWNLDLDTGATQRIAPLTPPIDRPEGIAFHPATGELFVSSATGDLYEVDPQTAATRFVGASGLTLRGHSFTPDGGRLLAFREGHGGLYEVNPATGAASLVGPGIPSALPEDSAFTSDGRLFVTEFHGSIYEVDPQTGTSSLVGDFGPDRRMLGMVAIPEPATIPAILCAVLLVRLRCRPTLRAVATRQAGTSRRAQRAQRAAR